MSCIRPPHIDTSRYVYVNMILVIDFDSLAKYAIIENSNDYL